MLNCALSKWLCCWSSPSAYFEVYRRLAGTFFVSAVRYFSTPSHMHARCWHPRTYLPAIWLQSAACLLQAPIPYTDTGRGGCWANPSFEVLETSTASRFELNLFNGINSIIPNLVQRGALVLFLAEKRWLFLGMFRFWVQQMIGSRRRLATFVASFVDIFSSVKLNYVSRTV